MVTCIWSTEFLSSNMKNDTSTTYDGGAYSIFAGGIHHGSSISGGTAGIYVAPDRSSGLFWGWLKGADFLGPSMFALEGEIEGRARMTGDVGFAPPALASNLESSPTGFYRDYFFPISGDAYYSGSGSSSRNTSQYLTFGTNRQWGIWKTEMYGGYYDPVGNWEFYLENVAPSGDQIHRWLAVTGTRWSGGTLEADAAGAWVNVDDAITGVMAGTVEGTYHIDDIDFGYWEAIGGGLLMDTATFLAYVDSKPGVLEAMNIPNIEVGKATLEGTGGYLGAMTVKMKDTRFFSYRSQDPPKIWASGSVTGNNPYGSQSIGPAYYVPLAGSSGSANVSADFILNSWAGNKWDARVEDGYGTVNGHDISFKGGAAGRYTGADLTGTAAGVAGPDGGD